MTTPYTYSEATKARIREQMVRGAAEADMLDARPRRRRIPHYEWRIWYARHMCRCKHLDHIHGKKGCEGVGEDGPCPCQSFEREAKIED